MITRLLIVLMLWGVVNQIHNLVVVQRDNNVLAQKMFDHQLKEDATPPIQMDIPVPSMIPPDPRGNSYAPPNMTF